MASYVFPKVEPADIQKSNRNLSLYKAFTASVGPLIPALSIDMLPDDWMRINTIATVQSLPMIAPVRGRWKVSFDYFYEPWSNLYGFMDNNSRLATKDIVDLARWRIHIGTSLVHSTGVEPVDITDVIFNGIPHVGSGSLLDYLGAPVGYFGNFTYNQSKIINGTPTNHVFETTPTEHPAESLLTYIDIVRNYYVNNQFAEIPYIKYSVTPFSVQTTTQQKEYGYDTIKLSDMDDLFRKLRYYSSTGSPQYFADNYNLSAGNVVPTLLASSMCLPLQGNESPWYKGTVSSVPVDSGRQCGLFLRSYRMDLLRGILNADVGSYSSKISVNGQYVTMDEIYFKNKLQQLINRIDITGGRFTDWVRTRWNVDTGIQVDRPIYLGSHSMWLNTIDVVATAAGQSGVASNNPRTELAQQAGYQVGKMSGKQKPITIKSKQYGTLMCIFSIVPDVVYSQGFELNMLKTKFADIYDPAFKQIGYQDVSKAEYDAFPHFSRIKPYQQDGETTITPSNLNMVVGKRVAWSEYMASLNRVHGDFAYGESLDYWVNNRVFSSGEPFQYHDTGYDNSKLEPGIMRRLYEFDASTYVYPNLWNYQFADTSLTAMNYMVDVYFAIDANRSLGKRLMPHM